MRELARRSSVSAAQISRIEAGEVREPSVSTLVDLARGLERNPRPLLIVAGRMNRTEALAVLRPMFRPRVGETYDLNVDSELVEEWEFRGREAALAHARAVIDDPDATLERLQELAAEVFLTTDTEETEWADSWLEGLARTGQPDIDELIGCFAELDPARRAKVLEYAREQRELATRTRDREPPSDTKKRKEDQ
jgi:transcriptional regulator with XRE-family HTH domain